MPPVQEATDSTTTREDDAEPLNPSVLTGLRELQVEGEPDLLDELIELFLTDVPPLLIVLREAVEGGDAHSVERSAHTLKGSCSSMGAIRMAEICEKLRETGTTGDLVQTSVLFNQLETEFNRVRSEFAADQRAN